MKMMGLGWKEYRKINVPQRVLKKRLVVPDVVNGKLIGKLVFTSLNQIPNTIHIQTDWLLNAQVCRNVALLSSGVNILLPEIFKWMQLTNFLTGGNGSQITTNPVTGPTTPTITTVPTNTTDFTGPTNSTQSTSGKLLQCLFHYEYSSLIFACINLNLEILKIILYCFRK